MKILASVALAAALFLVSAAQAGPRPDGSAAGASTRPAPTKEGIARAEECRRKMTLEVLPYGNWAPAGGDGLKMLNASMVGEREQQQMQELVLTNTDIFDGTQRLRFPTEWTVGKVDGNQTRAIVDLLLAEGFFDRARRNPAPGGPDALCCVLSVTGESVHYVENLGWGPPMLARLDALRAVLEKGSPAAGAMDKWMARFEPFRQWEKAGPATSAPAPRPVAAASAPAGIEEAVQSLRGVLGEFAKTPPLPDANADAVQFYEGVSHTVGGIVVQGHLWTTRNARTRPERGWYNEFHLDARGRVEFVVEHGGDGKRSLADRLLYDGNRPLGRLTFREGRLQFGDFAFWKDGLPLLVCRLDANGDVLMKPGVLQRQALAWDIAKRLGSDVFRERERAASQLEDLGLNAVTILEAGTYAEDLEVRLRCADVMERLAKAIRARPPSVEEARNEFNRLNPGYQERAGAYYEKEYLLKAVGQLAKAAGLGEKEEAAARKVLREFLYDWLESYARGGGRIASDDLSACLTRMDKRMRDALSPAAHAGYLTWRKDETGADNALKFLMRPHVAILAETRPSRPE